jgi:tripartite-type tricarboxylate transporter receptor subunit TctC
MKKLVNALAAVTLLCAGGTAVPAYAEFPERPITIIVPWPPGDIEDQLTRVIAEEMTRDTNVPTKVVNRPGGGAVEGATVVAQADPDGYTIGSLVIDVPTMHVIRGNATYKTDDFEPIGIFLTYPFGLVTLKDKPYKTMAELADYAKSNPVKLAHFGYDLVPSMATFAAAKRLGFKFSADAAYEMLDCSTLKNGDADVINTTMALVLACKDEITVLAAYTDQPLSIFPDAPLLSQVVPGLDITLWNGLFVPKGTPQDVKDKIAELARKAALSDKAREIAAPSGAGVYWMDAAQAAERIAKDYKTAQDLVKELQ